jgi:hypothetical protein
MKRSVEKRTIHPSHLWCLSSIPGEEKAWASPAEDPFRTLKLFVLIYLDQPSFGLPLENETKKVTFAST